MTLRTPKKPKSIRRKRKTLQEFFCLNCDQTMNEPKLFCSEACSDEAKFVRYVRRCRKDGREWDPDVNEAIKIRLAFILGGGYPEQKRQLSSSIRAAVIARDNERCQKCGQPGDQIDHIRGSSNSLENLQLLCRFCHNLKTKASMVTITPDSPQWEKCNAKKNALMKRIDAKKTKRACDDDEAWPSAWRSYWRKRKQIFSELSKKAKTIRRQ